MTSFLRRYFDLSGRRALVTGGSMSIGRAIAMALAESGADVAIQYAPDADKGLDRPEAATETIGEIAAMGRGSAAIAADFGTPGAAAQSWRDAEAAIGPLDILVICASVQSRGKFIDVTRAEIDRQIAINFSASIELLQMAAPAMAERGWGRVLSIGSINQTRPEAELSTYAALKAAQHNLIVNLARDYAGRGVTFNTLSPGLIATERNRWRRTVAAEWATIQENANPMRRAGTPEEMAGAALMLCSPGAGFITGADLQATGGGHL